MTGEGEERTIMISPGLYYLFDRQGLLGWTEYKEIGFNRGLLGMLRLEL
jgi:hypothetical protein